MLLIRTGIAACLLLGLLLMQQPAVAQTAVTDSPKCLAAIDPAIAQLVAGTKQTSVPTIKRLASNGCPRAQVFLGLMYIEGNGVRPDCAKGTKLVQDLAHNFYVEAQVFLGRLYEHGQCTKPNTTTAYQWYAIAAAHPQASIGREKARSIRRGQHVLLTDAEIKAGDTAAIAWWRARWK